MEKENTFDESMMTAVDELSDEERKLIFAEAEAGIDESDLPDNCTVEQYEMWLKNNGIKLK